MKIIYTVILFLLIGCQSAENKPESLQEYMRRTVERAKNAKPINSAAAATSMAKFKSSITKQEDKKEEDTLSYKVSYLIDYVPDSSLTFDADSTKVVFISPDSLEIEHMKQEYGEEDFYTIADDNLYYDYEAYEFLKEKEFEYKSTDKRFVKLIKESGKEIFVDTHKYDENWGVIIFNGKDEPIVVPSMEIPYIWRELN